MMVYFSLNNKEASREVTHEKYREEAEYVKSKRAREEAKTKAKENNKKNLKESQAKIYKTKKMMTIAISEALIRIDVITN
jgi:hypothetical protein